MKKIMTLIIGLFVVANFLIVPVTAFAQVEACQCWCGKDGEGAQKFGDKQPADCINFCEDQGAGWKYLICTNEINAKPPANVRCWSQEECSAKGGEWGTELPAECQAGPPEEHFCYPDPEPLTLNVALGSVTEVTDLGQYTGALYDWMLYAGIIIATVMVMIGGVEWMIGAGRDKVDSAKKRIYGALIGMILLLGAYTILATVNPKLVRLEVPQYPMIKQIYFIDDATTCEKLLELGYKLEYNSNEISGDYADTGCGEKATVIEGPEGGGTTVEECYFTHCDQGGCLLPQNTSSAEDTKPRCFQCTHLGPGSSVTDAPKPSPEVCSRIIYPVQGVGEGATYQLCRFSKDSGLVTLANEPEVKLDGTCALLTLDCGAIDACIDYDDVMVQGPETAERLDCTIGASWSRDPSLWTEICEMDICNAGANYEQDLDYDGDGISDETEEFHEGCKANIYQPVGVFWDGILGQKWDCWNTGAVQKESGIENCYNEVGQEVDCMPTFEELACTKF